MADSTMPLCKIQHDHRRYTKHPYHFQRQPNAVRIPAVCQIAFAVEPKFQVMLTLQIGPTQSNVLFLFFPGALPVKDVPQLVLISFDDAVNDVNWHIYEELLNSGRSNPNGCPIKSTFYVSHEW